MSFNIPKIESTDMYLQIALTAARKRLASFKASLRRGDPLQKQATLERERLNQIAKSIDKKMKAISKAFPAIDQLSEFYQQLIEATLDKEKLKKSLAATAWASSQITKLSFEYQKKLKNAQTKDEITKAKKQGLGRIASVLKQVQKNLIYLDDARKTLRTFPDIKEYYTVAIAGFPNVGKSTLLSKLTTARPEIKDYAFTTKTLNTGTFTYRHNQIQFIDTPGTLAREKQNLIEIQAEIAMRYAAHFIIYVYDVTEPFPLADQKALEKIVRSYGKEVILYGSKIDIVDKKEFEKLDVITDPAIIKEEVIKRFESDYL